MHILLTSIIIINEHNMSTLSLYRTHNLNSFKKNNNKQIQNKLFKIKEFISLL